MKNYYVQAQKKRKKHNKNLRSYQKIEHQVLNATGRLNPKTNSSLMKIKEGFTRQMTISQRA